MVVDHSPEKDAARPAPSESEHSKLLCSATTRWPLSGSSGQSEWWVNANTSRFGYEHGVYPRQWQFEVSKMTEMMGMDFQQHQSPEYLRFWSLYFQFLRISPFISIYCWVYRWILISCWFLRSSTFQQYTVPDFCFPVVRRNDHRQSPSPQSLRSAKPKPSERPQGCQNRAAGHALKFQFGVSTGSWSGFFDEFWLMMFSHSTTRLNQACVFWACRWIVMDR